MDEAEGALLDEIDGTRPLTAEQQAWALENGGAWVHLVRGGSLMPFVDAGLAESMGWLGVFGPKRANTAGLEHFVNLTDLISERIQFDPSLQFPSLEVYEGQPDPTVLANSPRLRQFATYGNGAGGERFVVNGPVETATILGARSMTELPRFEQPERLDHLRIYRPDRLSLAGIAELRNLRSLVLQEIRDLQDIEGLLAFSELRILFEDVSHIEDAALLLQLPENVHCTVGAKYGIPDDVREQLEQRPNWQIHSALRNYVGPKQ